MKTNIVVLSILAIYFGLLATVYTVWSLIADGAIEWAGSLAIALSGVLSLLIAFFLQIQFKNQGGELPEDRLEANIDDGDAELGFFSPWSWWPVTLAAGAAIAFAGLAVGFWVALYGLPLVLIGLVGWSYEYYRGYFAR
ncbi:MAG: cytochrome c oxidase subunit 4 [Microbacteriaceae bacterium]|nr:cytochrome c oxidase subunit 4 [Microbacteriaceae bacterium]